MASRRSSEWTQYVIDQLQGIHEVVFTDDDDREVCTCGLIAPDSKTEIQRVDGHIQGGLVTELLIHDFEDGKGHQLYCQQCREVWPVVRFADEESEDAGLIDLPNTLAQHDECFAEEELEPGQVSVKKRDELWSKMVANCRCERAGHHVFWIKHWKASGLNRPAMTMRHLGGTAFEIEVEGDKFVGHTHCPEVIVEMLTWGSAANWFFDVLTGGDEFHVVALGDKGAKRWFSFNRKPVPDCGNNWHRCKARTEKDGE
jgi:hypothetical protein